jgi:drug/metabolite transporter (DMT)-like permease
MQIKNNSQTTTQQAAAMELILAGALWGFGFVAAVWALDEMGPLTITFLRFAIASVVGMALARLAMIFNPQLRHAISLDQFKLALTPGILISLTLIIQTWGLQYTTATKSGFITTLYVLIVPFIEKIWLKRDLPRYHLFFASIAFIGVAFICDIPSLFYSEITQSSIEAAAPLDMTDAAKRLHEKLSWNFGDFLTLICAGLASLHILWFGTNNKKVKSAFVFNNLQSIWACFIPLIFAVTLEKWPTVVPSGKPLVGLLMLTFGSTLIAFALQVRAQQVISPSIASILFLLESPFAALFAFHLLNENLEAHQWFGAGMILISVFLSTLFAYETTESTTDNSPDFI